MAATRSNEPIEPMTLGNVRENGVVSARIMLRARGEATLCDAMAERPRAIHKSLASLTAVRVIAGVAVFALGVVAGVGFAALLMPPS